MGNERDIAEETESILASIDESSTDNDSVGGSISTNTLEDMWDGNYVNPDNNATDSRLKMRDRIIQAQSEWKG